jgi:dihydroorotate dehydrogenase (fumarate)
MTFTLTNTGNVSLGADTVSRITGIFGIPFSGDSRVAVPELLPGTSRTVSIPVEGVGQWMFLSASVDLVGTIDNDAINPGPLPTAKRDVMIFAMPWFAVVVLISGVAIYFGLRAKRRRDAVRAQEWLDFAAATAAAEVAAEAAAAKKTASRAKSAESKKPNAGSRPRKSDDPS